MGDLLGSPRVASLFALLSFSFERERERERERDSYASPSLKARHAVGEREVSHDGFALKSV